MTTKTTPAISEWNGGHAIAIFIQWNRQVELSRQMAKEKV